jgi:hypothetical protein
LIQCDELGGHFDQFWAELLVGSHLNPAWSK